MDAKIDIWHDGDSEVGDPPQHATVELLGVAVELMQPDYRVFVFAQLERAFKAIWDVSRVNVELHDE